MRLSRKFSQFVQALNETFPPEAEREPTIAEDYPEKWDEIQRRSRAIDVLCWICWGAVLVFVLCGLYGNFVAPLSDEQRRFALNAIAAVGFTFYVSTTYLSWFRCPRCQKTFQNPTNRGIFHYTARCQHCNLNMARRRKKALCDKI